MLWRLLRCAEIAENSVNVVENKMLHIPDIFAKMRNKQTLKKMSAIFLKVDLVIEAPEPFDHVCRELVKAGAIKIYNGETEVGFLATFELKDTKEDAPNSIIDSFCDIVADFDDQARVTWDQAHRRTFNINYLTDNEEGAFYWDLKNKVLARVAELRADISLMLFPRSPENQTSREKQ